VLVLDMIKILPPLGKYKYDTWRILPMKCYIDNFVRLRSCIRNIQGNTLRYDLGSDSSKVPGSDSGKESGTISGKNPGKLPGKKSGRELPDRGKTRVRRPGKTKMYKTRRHLYFG
jgi:hypothetical protein